MSSLFKKKSGTRRNLRRKNDSSDTDDVEIGGSESLQKNGEKPEDCGGGNSSSSMEVTSSTNIGLGGKETQGSLSTAPSTSSLLSFGQDDDDDDATMIKIKKSSHSRRLEKFRRKIRQQREEEPVGEEEKQRHSDSPDSTTQIVPEQKVRVEEADSTNNFVPLEDKEVSEETRPSRIGVLEGEEHDFLPFISGSIPDAQAVYLARKRRQKAREGGEFIPLVDDTQRFQKDKSRLVRDDDNDESDMEEEGGSFYSTRKLRDLEETSRRKAQEDFLDIEQGESDEERDQEFAAWEREQIRKGVSSQQIQSLQQDQYTAAMYAAEQQYYAAYGTLGLPTRDGKESSLFPDVETKDPEPMELDMEISGPSEETKKHRLPKIGGAGGDASEKRLSIDDIILRMKSRMLDSGQVARGRRLEKEKLESLLEDNQETVKGLEEVRPLQDTQYTLHQETRAYLRDLLDCLNEKVEKIDGLTSEMMNLLKGRQDFLVRRRRQDVKDQFEECSAAGSGKLGFVQKDAEKMMRIADRDARRGRRRQGREKTLAGMSHQEGTSSDEEEAPSRIAAFTSDTEKILKEAESIFQDTLEEFCTVAGVCEKFVNWIEKDPGSFEDAYMGLCLPKVLTPIVKFQMMAWNPLRAECAQLSSFPWYRESLLMGSERNLETDTESVVSLIPALVEKVICQKLEEIVRSEWDPSSESQTGRLARVLLSLMEEYPEVNAESKPVHRLLAAVEKRAKETLDDDLFMPIYGQEAMENSATGAKAFLDRQFWFALKVFKNLVLLEGFVGSGVVQEMVLDGILNRQLVLGLQCSVFSDPGTLLKCRAVVNAIPHEWTRNISETVIRQLEPFAKLLRRIGEEVYKARTHSSYKETVREVHRMLSKLGLSSHARMFAEHVGLKL